MRVALIDHSFHKQTRSSDFFRALLKKYFEVDDYWDDRWQGGAAAYTDALRETFYDIVIFWQILPDGQLLAQLPASRIVLVPMFDDARLMHPRRWLRYRHCRFLCFSAALCRLYRRLGLRAAYFQYFPAPEAESVQGDGLKGFFWARVAYYGWEHIRPLVAGAPFVKFHYHLAPDPGQQLHAPPPDEQAALHMTVSRWFESRAALLAALRGCNVYFVSRPHEGIGMSFLEAMALGQCVVAPDRPTMNEYIRHGENGILYDPVYPRPIDFSKAAGCGVRALASVREGQRRWQGCEAELVNFLTAPQPATGVAQARRVLYAVAGPCGLYTSLIREFDLCRSSREGAP